jgi:cytochrome P450
LSDVDEAPAQDPMSAMDPETARCPQPVFKLLREAAPAMPMEGSVVLTTRALVDEALRHPEIYSSNVDAVSLQNVRPMIPLQIDPPDHKKYRKILDPLFAPKRMAALEEPVAKLVNDLLDEIEAGLVDGSGEIDFAPQFSVPFPSLTFCRLMGLPLEELDTFLKMKDGIIRPNHVVGAAFGSKEAVAYQKETADSVYAFFDRVLDEREAEPRDDLLTGFLHTEVDGEQLTRNDILDICFLFLIAGLDTVTSSLDCFYGYLAQHPDQRQRIVDDPSIIPNVVEELLRWETPVMGIVRVALEDTEIGGCPVKKGDHVQPLLASANCDEAEMPDADEVRFDRESNRHIAFGGGVHRCLGSHLARLELRVALREWHKRFPVYSVKPDHELVYTGGIRSIEHFPMVLGE